MDPRFQEKEQELRRLYAEFKKNPALFEKKTYIEDAALLSTVGIDIPHKHDLPNGYLRLWAQDFIVEEIDPTGKVIDITYQNVFTKDTPLGDDQTIYATLVKCNLPTIEVVKSLVRHFGCDVNQIQYAGLKDKDAITSQRISLRNIDKAKLRELNSQFFFLKDVTTGKGVIQKGELKGNRFTMLIRIGDELRDKEKIGIFASQVKYIIDNGFYNFYYLQRFGTPRFINFTWARLILQEKYREAIWAFLTDIAPSEGLYYKTKREELKKQIGNWSEMRKVLEPFPIIFANELKVIKYLEEHPLDFVQALHTIQDQVAIWMYSFSSYLFNKKISACIAKNELPPKKLSLPLSFKRDDWLPYENELKEMGVFPLKLRELTAKFPFVNILSRQVSTMDHVEIHKMEVVEEGIILSFSLGKGEYATTFLSHLFNLMAHYPPAYIKDTQIDTKAALGEDSMQATLDYFKEINHPKTSDIFKQFEAEEKANLR